MITKRIDSGWWRCYDINASGFISEHKLHIALPVEYYDDYHGIICQLLERAVEDKVIPCFKMLNSGNSEVLQQRLNEDSEETRAFNNPFTIYLFSEQDTQPLKDLCSSIERILSATPNIDTQTLSLADLRVSNHISFRQDRENGEYIAIHGADETTLGRMRHSAEESDLYINLTTGEEEEVKREESIYSTSANESRSNEVYNIIHFYDKNFQAINEQLTNRNVATQLNAALGFLKIDREEFLNSDKKNLLINKQYRKLARKYHPDKYSSLDKETLSKIQSLFNLLIDSKTLLEDYTNSPQKIKNTEILKQSPYIPTFQYELEEGYNGDRYFYQNLASSTEYCNLYVNWELIDTNTEQADSDESQALQIYSPTLHLYTGKNRKTIQVKKYVAFYHLYMADAVSGRFCGEDLINIFYHGFLDDGLTPKEADKYLVEKLFTTPKMIYAINNLEKVFNIHADRAKRDGYKTNIFGRNSTEFLIYLCKNLPEVLRLGAIINVCESEYFDHDLFKNYLMSEAKNFYLFNKKCLAYFLIQYPEALENYLSSYNSPLNIKSSYLDHKINDFLLELNADFSKLVETSIKQAIYGDISLLFCLSDEVFYNIKEVFNNSVGSNNFFHLILSHAIDKRENNSTEITHDAVIELRKLFWEDKEIINEIDKDSLIILASQPEVHWTDCLNISKRLCGMGEEQSAWRYVTRIFNELERENSSSDIYESIDIAERCINELTDDFREKVLSDLKEEYIDCLEKEGQEGKLEVLEESFEVIGGIDKRFLRKLHWEYLNLNNDSVYLRLEASIAKIKTNGINDEIKEEIKNIQRGVSHTIFDWADPLCNNQSPNAKHHLTINRVTDELFALFGKKVALIIDGDLESETENYGLSLSQPLNEFLENFCDLCSCLNIEKEMLHKIFNITRRPKKLQAMGSILKSETFNYELTPSSIIEYLKEYLNTELHVYSSGFREDHNYIDKINHGFATFYNNIKNPINDFQRIYDLYIALGLEDYFLTKLPEVYENLIDWHNETNDSLPLERYEIINDSINNILTIEDEEKTQLLSDIHPEQPDEEKFQTITDSQIQNINEEKSPELSNNYIHQFKTITLDPIFLSLMKICDDYLKLKKGFTHSRHSEVEQLKSYIQFIHKQNFSDTVKISQLLNRSVHTITSIKSSNSFLKSSLSNQLSKTLNLPENLLEQEIKKAIDSWNAQNPKEVTLEKLSTDLIAVCDNYLKLNEGFFTHSRHSEVKELSDRIKFTLNQENHSASKISQLFDISIETISSINSSNSYLKRSLLYVLVETLNVPITGSSTSNSCVRFFTSEESLEDRINNAIDVWKEENSPLDNTLLSENTRPK
ncbi:MAG: hypothetical protein ACE365_03005 [Gammaproteobacteria bacterium]